MRVLWILGCIAAVLASGCPKDEDPSSDAGVDEGGGTAGTGQTADGGAGSMSTAGGGGSAGASGASGSGSGSDAGSGSGSGGSGSSGSGGDECPSTCLRAYTCAASCADAPFNNGCCACPEGTIDTITCPASGCGQGAPGCGEEGAACCDPAPCDGPNFCHGALQCCGDACAVDCGSNGGGRCTIPCSGVAPDEQVQADCYALTTETECTTYESGAFPYRCEWQSGPPEPCLAP